MIFSVSQCLTRDHLMNTPHELKRLTKQENADIYLANGQVYVHFPDVHSDEQSREVFGKVNTETGGDSHAYYHFNPVTGYEKVKPPPLDSREAVAERISLVVSVPIPNFEKKFGMLQPC